VISTDGASQLSKQVVGNVTEVTQLLKDSTGIDLASLLSGFAGGRSAVGAGAAQGAGHGTRPVAHDDAPVAADAAAPSVQHGEPVSAE
jgi:flotillin